MQSNAHIAQRLQRNEMDNRSRILHKGWPILPLAAGKNLLAVNLHGHRSKGRPHLHVAVCPLIPKGKTDLCLRAGSKVRQICRQRHLLCGTIHGNLCCIQLLNSNSATT